MDAFNSIPWVPMSWTIVSSLLKMQNQLALISQDQVVDQHLLEHYLLVYCYTKVGS